MYKTIAEIKAKNREIGHHWFEQGAMRFFGTRIESQVIAGRYFITSEQPPRFGDGNQPLPPRTYSVRRANDDGSITTVSEFGQLRTRQEAKALALEMAEKEAV